MPFHRAIAWIFALILCLATPWAQADGTAEVEALLQSKQWALAQQRIQTLTQQSPQSAQSPQWRLMSSQALAGQGKTTEAMAILQALIQEFPELPEPHNNLGVLWAAQGQLEAAAAALQMAIQARPHYKTALKNLGDVYTAMAQDAYKKSNQITPGNTLLPLPLPAAETTTTTTTNTRTLR
jgi:tetratricopeptide (TPR) repeat protein